MLGSGVNSNQSHIYQIGLLLSLYVEGIYCIYHGHLDLSILLFFLHQKKALLLHNGFWWFVNFSSFFHTRV